MKENVWWTILSLNSGREIRLPIGQIGAPGAVVLMVVLRKLKDGKSEADLASTQVLEVLVNATVHQLREGIKSNLDGLHSLPVFRTCNLAPTCPVTKTASEFASDACQHFRENGDARLVTRLTGEGVQADHDSDRPKHACTVYCKQGRTPDLYSPQTEFADNPSINLFFPDGSWCHNDGTVNYHCVQHVCTSEATHRGGRADTGKDIPLMMNAIPDDVQIKTPEEELTADASGKPKANNVNINNIYGANDLIDNVQFNQPEPLPKNP